MRTRVWAGSATVFALTAAVLGTAPAGAADADGFGKDAWWYQAMRIDDAHKIATGKGVTIAVIDGPIDPTVPELRGQDVTPVKNFCGGKPTGTGPIASHGTSMVVNIAGNGRGTGPGKVGVAGVAPGSTVRTYGVDGDASDGLQCGTVGVRRGVADAISASLDDGADIISISLSFGAPDSVEQAAVEQALAAGAVVVASSGEREKDSAVTFPAAYPGVVSVSAVDRNAKPWAGNVQGNRKTVSISAPGAELTTGTFVGNNWSSTVQASGTSGSTSLVAGSLAVVKSRYQTATGNQLIANMIRNPGGTQGYGFTPDFGYGIISLPNMLASDPAQWPDTNPLITANTAAPTSAGESQALDGSDEDGGGFPVWIPVLAVLAVAGAAGAVLLGRSRSRTARG